MDNSALLARISEMLQEQTKCMDARFEEQNQRFDAHLEERLGEHTREIDARLNDQARRLDAHFDAHTLEIYTLLEAHTRRIEVKIENDVTKRIDALTDGYKLTHEKQEVLERQSGAAQAQIDDLQTRVTVLEERTA